MKADFPSLTHFRTSYAAILGAAKGYFPLTLCSQFSLDKLLQRREAYSNSFCTAPNPDSFSPKYSKPARP